MSENRQLEAPVELSKDAPVAGAKIGQEADAGSVDRRHDLTRVDGEYRTSIIIDPVTGQVPKRKEFLDHVAQFAASGIRATDGPETLQIATRCIHPLLVPSILPMPYSTLLQIVQTKDHVVLHTELIHDARVVRLNGTHAKHGGKIWMGDSIGRFEGDTLIVHTVNFRPEQSDPEMPVSEDLELTERFTRVGQDEIVYSFTAVGPKAYTESIHWRAHAQARAAAHSTAGIRLPRRQLLDAGNSGRCKKGGRRRRPARANRLRNDVARRTTRSDH